MIGGTDDPAPYIRNSALILSTSYSESFSLSLVEAQSWGLPAVMYELPLMPAYENSSIISVPQGDRKAAAAEIVSLLTDEQRLSSLSIKAHESSQRFFFDKYESRLRQIISTSAHLSDISFYTRDDYAKVIKVLAFYGGHLPPWLKK